MKFIVFTLAFFSFMGLYAQSQLENFKSYDSNVSRKKIITNDRSKIKIERKSENPSEQNGDIHLVKIASNGDVVWSKYYGGSGYEYIGSFLRTKDKGYAIVGTTSSFGNGNNDVYLIKIDSEGNELWSKTYGGFFNEYGYYVKEEKNGNLIIKGKKQFCKGENVGTGCYDKTWIIRTTSTGEKIEEQIIAFNSDLKM